MILKSKRLTKKQKEDAVHKLFEDSTPNYDFYLMLVLSGMIITFGLLLSNVAVVIGGMLVAPILSPILSMSMGIIMSDIKLIRRSGQVIIQSVLLVIAISLVSSLLTVNRELNVEIISRAYPNLYYLLIAIFSGVAVAYAIVKPQMSETLPGVAITVALIPPLAAIGVALSFLDWNIAIGALGLFALNLVGIIFAAMVVFALLNFYEVKKSIKDKIKAEEAQIAKVQKENQEQKLDELVKKVDEAKILIESKKRGKN